MTYFKKSLFLTGFCLITIFGLGVFLYDDDLSDTDNPPDIALQYSVIIYCAAEITRVGLTSESVDLPFINKISLVDRAPPA